MSDQQPVDCVKNADNDRYNGCIGNTPYAALDYWKANNAILDSDYPYTSADYTDDSPESECLNDSSRKTRIKVKSYHFIGNKTEEGKLQLADGDQIKTALSNIGPIQVSVQVDSFASGHWKHYTGGCVFDCPDCPSGRLNHSVLLVGYGIDKGTEYFLVKNSWGTNWGDQGYMKIINKENGVGQSGMFINPIYAVTMLEDPKVDENDHGMATLVSMAALTISSLFLFI